MSNRESFINILERKPSAAIPADVWESLIHSTLQDKLLEYYGLGKDEEDKLYNALEACTRRVVPIYCGPPLEELDWGYEPSWPFTKVEKSIWGTPENLQTYSDIFERPLAGAQSTADVENFNWPTCDLFDYSRYSWFNNPDLSYSIDEWAEKYSDCGRVISGWNPLFSRLMDMFGMEQGLLNFALKPEVMQAATERIGWFLETYYENTAKATSHVGDVLGFGDDFAGQNGMLVNPALWREMFLPVWKKLFAIAHKYNMKAMMHLCGGVAEVLPDLIDAGLDIYQNVQLNAKGMDMYDLKKEYGSDLIFYGGIDVQNDLLFCNEEQVAEIVKKTIEVLGEGGGYIVASTHFLLDDLPYKNVISMYETVKKYNKDI